MRNSADGCRISCQQRHKAQHKGPWTKRPLITCIDPPLPKYLHTARIIYLLTLGPLGELPSISFWPGSLSQSQYILVITGIPHTSLETPHRCILTPLIGLPGVFRLIVLQNTPTSSLRATHLTCSHGAAGEAMGERTRKDVYKMVLTADPVPVPNQKS